MLSVFIRSIFRSEVKMKSINLILLTLSIFGIISCENAADYSLNIIDQAIVIADPFENSLANLGNNLKSLNYENQCIIYSFSWKDQAVFMGNLKNGLKKYDLRFLSEEIEFSIETDFVLSSNTEAFILDNNKRVFKINLDKKDFKIFDLSQYLNRDTYPFSYWAYPMITTSQSSIDIPITYGDLILSNTKEMKDYFLRPVAIHIDLKNDTIIPFTYGKFPSIYQNEDFYNDYYCKLAMAFSNKRILSFNCSDSVFIYSGSQMEKYFFGFTPNPTFKPFNLTMLKKMQFKRQYVIEQPQYLQIVYDPYRKILYRVFKHSSNFTDKDGLVIESNKVKWSLIISDLSFKTQRIISFEDGLYSPIGMIPLKEGLYIQKFIKKNHEIAGSIFEINLN